MTQERTYSNYFEDIIEASEKAQAFIEGMNFQDFLSDDRTNYAVVRCLEIVGEAAGRVPATIRLEYPEIPWRKMINTRNILIHNYDKVKLDLVWDTVTDELPHLLDYLSSR